MTRTLALPELVEAPPASDPFCYGTRTIRRRQADGSFQSLRMPLTLWDVLHPQEGDHIVQSIRHSQEVRYLAGGLEVHAARDAHALVKSDSPIHWDVPGLSHHAPDVALIFNVRDPREYRSSFQVTWAGVRPTLIIEVVSPQNREVREVDTVTKVVEYHAAMVPLYVIIDREREDDWPVIRGYRYTPEAYEPIALDDEDCLLLTDLNLRLLRNQNRIALYDAVTGRELGDHVAVSQALEAEMAARQAAEKEARLARERADAAVESQRLAEEQARDAAAAKQRRGAGARRRRSETAREEQARTNAEAHRRAEEQAHTADAARAELERQLRELQAALPPPARWRRDFLTSDKELLIDCAAHLESAWKVCGLFARAYPEQASAIAAVALPFARTPG